jgi:hypothetical protein
MMSKETIDTLMLLGTLTMFVGGPTTIAAGIATRLAVRGGMMLARRLAVGAVSGAVATGAAFIYMNAQGGGSGSGVPGFPAVSDADLAVETVTFSYEEDEGMVYFELNDNGQQYSLEDTKALINHARNLGKTKEIQINDRVGENAKPLVNLRNFTQTSGLNFNITDEPVSGKDSE